MIDVSIVIPLLDEEESLPKLTEWIQRVVKDNQYSYEIVFIDDGSTDNSWEVINQLRSIDPNIKGIRFRRNYGKSAALNSGFQHTTGKVVITMDADLQDSPDEIPALYKMITEENYDLVSGWKKKRYDPISKTIPTKIFNGFTSRMSGIKLHDFNCGLKAYSHDVVKNIEVYGEMHRYIPVIAKWAGFNKIGEKVVQHRARQFGRAKFFGFERFIRGPLDLISIIFVSKFGKRPMHFFGSIGSVIFFAGFVILGYLSIAKIIWKETQMTDRPLFYLGIVALIVGVQLFSTGFLAELVSRHDPRRNNYQIKEKNGFE